MFGNVVAKAVHIHAGVIADTATAFTCGCESGYFVCYVIIVQHSIGALILRPLRIRNLPGLLCPRSLLHSRQALLRQQSLHATSNNLCRDARYSLE